MHHYQKRIDNKQSIHAKYNILKPAPDSSNPIPPRLGWKEGRGGEMADNFSLVLEIAILQNAMYVCANTSTPISQRNGGKHPHKYHKTYTPLT